MKATKRLHDLGQSLRLDNITRGLLTSGTLRELQREGALAFDKSWNKLIDCLNSKRDVLGKAA